MDTSAISSITGSIGSNAVSRFDPSKMMDAMVKRLVKKSDGDGDGTLSSSELSGLSADAFKSLDSDGDGKLSSDEIKTAVTKAMDEMKKAMSSDNPQQAMEALKDTPEGQLMQLMRPPRHQHGNGSGNGQQTQTSIQITINQTIYNINGGSVQSSSSTSGVDVSA